MRKRGYSPGFAAGIIAAGGTLGILLPPSITMILYAVAAEQSLGRLFLAGIGPGCCWSRCSPPMRRCATARNTAGRRRAYEATARLADLDEKTFYCAEKCRDAAARPAVRGPADRRDGRALRRLRDAFGDGGPRRPAGARADRHHLRHVWRRGDVAPILAATLQGIDDADVHHRHVAAVLLRDELPAHQPVGRAGDRRACTCRNGCCSPRSC